MKQSIAAFFLAFCFFSLFAKEAEQFTAKEYFEDLEKNTFSLDFTDKKIIDKVFALDNLKKHKAILIGEIHGVAANYTLKSEFLEYFTKAGYCNTLLEEAPVSHNLFLNKYLETGDEKILKTLFTIMRGTAYCTQEHYDFFKKLYQYNQTAPKKQRIRILAVDVEHQPILAYAAQHALLKEKKNLRLFSDLQSKLAAAAKKAQFPNNDPYAIAEECEKLLQENQKEAKNVLGKDYTLFALINRNILSRKKLDSCPPEQFNTIRDKQLYENFCALDLPKNTYFGVWGNLHVFQVPIDQVTYFAGHLTQNKNYSGKITSIAIQYIKSEFSNKDDNYLPYPCENRMLYFDDAYQQQLETDKGDIYIFRLNTKDSLFRRTDLNFQKADKGDPVISDVYQYLITVKNSPACKKYSGD